MQMVHDNSSITSPVAELTNKPGQKHSTFTEVGMSFKAGPACVGARRSWTQVTRHWTPAVAVNRCPMWRHRWESSSNSCCMTSFDKCHRSQRLLYIRHLST